MGHRRWLIVSALAAALCFVPQAFVHDTRALIFWQLVSGLAVGGTLSTVTALLARLAPDGRQGIVFGLDASAVASANAIGPLIGAAVAAGLGLRAPFLLSAAFLVVGALTVVLWVQERGRQLAPADIIA